METLTEVITRIIESYRHEQRLYPEIYAEAVTDEVKKHLRSLFSENMDSGEMTNVALQLIKDLK